MKGRPIGWRKEISLQRERRQLRAFDDEFEDMARVPKASA